MSSERADVVRRALDAYTRRDADTFRAVTVPDFELDWSASLGWLAGVYRGIEECLRFYADYFEAFVEIEIVPDRLIEVHDAVVVPNVAHQRGRDGIEVSARSTLLFTFAGDKIARICLYQETEQALAAAGLAG
jgi:ketosteroid isomerase-like protein